MEDQYEDNLRDHAIKYRRYRRFDKTYAIVTMAMCLCFMYPNEARERKHLLYLGIYAASFVPLFFICVIEMYLNIWNKDRDSLIRAATIVIPVSLSVIKVFLMNTNRAGLSHLLDIINKDYRRFCKCPDEHKQIVDKAVAKSIANEKTWTITCTTAMIAFPMMCVIQSFYNVFFGNGRREMVHHITFFEVDGEYPSPYYELMYAYSLYIVWNLGINFIGLDGCFSICINHANLRIKLFGQRVKEAFFDVQDEALLKERLVDIIKEQSDTFKFVEVLQDTFGLWLFMVFLGTSGQLCVTLYQVALVKHGLDVKYFTFVIATVVHCFFPCYSATILKDSALQSATDIYCCGWEKTPSKDIRLIVIFMIARAQIPLQIQAVNMIIFDMSLFISVMQTSYSMFTLLHTTNM